MNHHRRSVIDRSPVTLGGTPLGFCRGWGVVRDRDVWMEGGTCKVGSVMGCDGMGSEGYGV